MIYLSVHLKQWNPQSNLELEVYEGDESRHFTKYNTHQGKERYSDWRLVPYSSAFTCVHSSYDCTLKLVITSVAMISWQVLSIVWIPTGFLVECHLVLRIWTGQADRWVVVSVRRMRMLNNIAVQGLAGGGELPASSLHWRSQGRDFSVVVLNPGDLQCFSAQWSPVFNAA